MFLNSIFFAILIFLISFAFRYKIAKFYDYFYQRGFNGDSSVHYVLIRFYKEKRGKEYIEEFLIGKEPISYPTLYHKITGYFFSLPLIQKYPFLPNIFYFSIFNIFVYLLLLTSEVNITLYFIIFFMSISNILFIRDNTTYLGLSERYFARITTSLSFLSLTLAVNTMDFRYMVVSVLFGVIAVLSSKFARQVFLFVYSIYSLLIFNYFPFLVLMLIFLIAYLIKGKEFLFSLQYMYQHLANYSKNKPTDAKDALSHFLTFKKLFEIKSIRDFIENVLLQEPISLLVRFPEIIFIVFIALFSSNLSWELLSPVVAVFVVYLLISSERLNFLGEAHRYFDYALYYYFPFLLVFVFTNNLGLYLGLYIIYNLFIFIVYLALRKDIIHQNGDILSEFLRDIYFKPNDVVYPIPLRLGPDLLVRQKCKTFWWQPGNINKKVYKKFIEKYPFPKRDWQKIFDEYGVNFVLCNKKLINDVSFEYDFNSLRLIQENEYFALYKVI